jgi:hypothetical protein
LSFNEDNDNQSILFTPLRYINKEIYAVTSVAAAKPEVQRMVIMTPYQADVAGKPKLEAPKPVVKAAPVTEDDAVEEPKKRESKKVEAPTPTPKKSLDSVVAAWTDED